MKLNRYFSYMYYLKWLLREFLKSKGFGPKDKLCIDDQEHTYQTFQKGRSYEATYTASLVDYHEDDLCIICVFGRSDQPNQRNTFTMSLQKVMGN